MTSDYDAVVIGAGHNGLVAGVTLAKAGWRVAVLEAADRAGGALKSAEITRPGYVHDLFATNLNLFTASAFYAENAGDLARHGFVLATTTRPYASAFPDGTALRVSTDLAATLADLGNESRQDARGFEELHALYQKVSGTLFEVYGSTVPSLDLARTALKGARALGVQQSAALSRLLVSSCRELLDQYFLSEKVKALIAPWGLHLDLGPDVAGGAIFPFLEAFADLESGMSVAEGGASRLVDALVAILAEHGGVVRTDARVSRILVEGGRATGVELAGGERIGASRALVANVTPNALATDLLEPGDLPPTLRRALAQYTYGPATMMVHLALRGPVPWAAGEELQTSAYVHLAPYLDDLARTYGDALAGRLPVEPLLVVGQTSAVDPSRAPAGRHVLWVQVRALPQQIREDPGGTLAGSTWDHAGAPYAERVLAKLERYAPGLGGLVEDLAVLSPADLERADANLVGGDSISGSMHLSQSFCFRPTFAMSRYRTPIPGLWLVGAGTWPGPGVNAVSGYRASQAILARASGLRERTSKLAGRMTRRVIR